jgi:two-component system, NarL family, invasion response regulator UvrY
LLAEKTTEDIADMLHLSSKMVANMLGLITCEMGAGSDIELVLPDLRQGILVEPSANCMGNMKKF